MKIVNKYKKTALIAGIVVIFSSCGQEDQPKESQLDFNQPIRTELDNWIVKNYLNPYNINTLYKWNQNTVDNSRFLFPPTIDKVQPALEIVKKIWLKSYETIGGADFVKKIAPREFVLVGGVNSNESGTRILGIAEGGQRITLFEVDYLDNKKREIVKEFVHTIQHEYIHILNQTKPFDEQAWAKITPSGYTAIWHLDSDAKSRELGFITSYARSNIVEDFAETASVILINTKQDYEAILAGIGSEKARNDIKKKEAIVVKYFKDTFNMDFYALRDEAEKNTTDVIKGNY
ncbi:putative zinc-binding metallopeptidase [Flavobacterium sp. ALJ2]|uniref:zinc-binding metallopeptidase n=1 Tax=Flavobacterium sp. ALJ2 TaxID=2786960 RepID=UPI00189CD59C|nr:putative zinc-binding metallopeptidase [Flavobacterium sp. ALJ2]MBF7093061.1 putative zinc-binding metallopeptidase [Flavobacterium sp. ALJ2]